MATILELTLLKEYLHERFSMTVTKVSWHLNLSFIILGVPVVCNREVF